MNTQVLLVLLGLQGAVLLLLFLLLLWNHFYRSILSRRQVRGADRFRDALRRWKDGEEDPEALEHALEECAPGTVAKLLQGSPAQLDRQSWRRFRRTIRDTRWYERAIAGARSFFWWRRLASAELLGLLGTAGDAPLLEQLMDDSHPAVSTATLLAIREIRAASLMEPLLDRAEETGLGTQRELLLDVVSGYGRALVDPLRRRLEAPAGRDARVVQLVLGGRLGDPALVEAVRRHTRKGDLEIRINAVRALASLGRELSEDALLRTLAVDPLRRALTDPAWEVRVQAASGLGDLGAVEAIDELKEGLFDPAWWVRLRTALALRRLGEPGVRVLESVDPEEDAYGHEMARYVLQLDEVAVAEYAA